MRVKSLNICQTRAGACHTLNLCDGKARTSLGARLDIWHSVIEIVITHHYTFRDAQYHLFILAAWIHSIPRAVDLV